MSGMSEYKQLRPRLTEQEIRFIIHALVRLEEHLEEQQEEIKVWERKVYVLRKELFRNSMVYKDLKLAREQLAQAKANAQGYWPKKIICRSLLRRFRAMVKGRKLHTSSWAFNCLTKILEPETL